MKIEQIGVQLYTVRDYLKTPREIAESLKRIRAIGFQAVELAGLGTVATRDFKEMLDGEGLACFSSHEAGEQIFSHTADVIEKLKALGCPVAAFPYPSGIPLETEKDVKAFIRQLDDAGRRLRDAGIGFLYHNHNMEFRRIGGALILDMIFNSIDPRVLGAELDTYWVQAGGNDPARWCAKLKGRLPILHMKDFGVQDKYEGVPLSVFKEIGRGNLDWPGIIAAAEKAGCTQFIVEQDSNWIEGDPFKSLKASFDFITEKLCG